MLNCDAEKTHNTNLAELWFNQIRSDIPSGSWFDLKPQSSQ